MLTHLTKQVLETALEEELSDHLGYDHGDRDAKAGTNERNGSRVVLSLMRDETQLFKQFSDNDSFRAWLADAVFRQTYGKSA